MSLEEQTASAVAQLRSYGAVAVLGAGLSAPRYPMTAQLPALLWHAIESNQAESLSLARELGKTDAPAKKLIGSDPTAVEAAWRIVESHPAVRKVFQRAFAQLDSDREPTPAHYGLARLIHAGIIEYVISLNWDTALERAYEQLFGTTLTGKSNVLTKSHGDAANTNEDWVLPHQPGVVPESVRNRIVDLGSERPRCLLVVGYSGSDTAIVDQLLEPAQGRWPVIRIGPSISGPETITGFADEVIPAIADKLNAQVDMVGWRWVGFSRSRDLRAALMGYRLGPQDVQACPKLPAAPRVTERLRQAHFAVIDGDSGAGKSITAFQAAHELHLDGWLVVELSEPGVASLESARTFRLIRGPVLAVADDAQAIDPDVIQALERSVSDDHAVVLVVTDRGPSQERVRVVGAHAVTALTQFCEEHSGTVEPLVAEIDDRVGYGMGREPFPRRLQAAAKSVYPWQFMSVLSGGEQRIADALEDMADEGETDLLFGILAAAQLLTLDAGISRDALIEHAQSIGRGIEWLDDSLAALAGHRLVVGRGDLFRTPHMRIADRGLLALCRDATNPRWNELLSYLRSRLLDSTQSLRGKLWMLRAIDQADPLRYGSPSLVLDKEAAWLLVNECLATASGRERSIAAYLLWEVDWWKALDLEMTERIATVLPIWISELTSDDVYGIQWLLGGLRSSFPRLHSEVCSQVAPEAIASRFVDHGSPAAGESWGRIVTEVSQAEGVDSEDWASRFEDAVDDARIPEVIRRSEDRFSLWGSAELASELAFTAPRIAAAIVRAITPAVRNRLENDVARGAQEVSSWAFNVFLLAGVERGEEGDVQCWPLREAVIDLIEGTDWESVGRSLPKAQLHETKEIDLLTYSIHRLVPDAITRMGTAISLDELDRIAEGQWHDLRQIQHLVVSLGLDQNREPARTWVTRHADEIQQMPTRVVPIAPHVAAGVVGRGGQIELEVQNGLRWEWCAEALQTLVATDRSTAVKVVEDSRQEILKGLELKQANMVENLDDFVEALDSIDPTVLDRLLGDLDPEIVRQHWSDRLQGSSQERKAVGILIDRALQSSGPIRTVVRELSE